MQVNVANSEDYIIYIYDVYYVIYIHVNVGHSSKQLDKKYVD